MALRDVSLAKALETAIDEVLLAEGFEKRGRTWVLDGPDCVGTLKLRT